MIPAALEFLAIDDGFTLIAEADGSQAEAAAAADELRLAMSAEASSLETPATREEITALWRWRDEISVSVTGRRGGKLSEDITVPVSALRDLLALKGSELPKRLSRPLRSAPGISLRPAAGGTPATATCTRPSCSIPLRRTRYTGPRLPRANCLNWRCGSVDRFQASTDWERSSRERSLCNGPSGRSSCMMKSSGCSTRRACSTRARSWLIPLTRDKLRAH